MPSASIQALFEGNVSSLEELAPLFYKEIWAPHTGTPTKQGSSDIDQAERDIDRLPLLIRVAKSVVADIQSWTDEQAAELAWLDYQDSLRYYRDANTKAERCLGIIIEAEAWNPITIKHRRFKKTLVAELQDYVSEFDILRPAREKTGAEYKSGCLRHAEGDVRSYETQLRHQKERFSKLDSDCEDLNTSIRTHSTMVKS